jgi:hypothetical protein
MEWSGPGDENIFHRRIKPAAGRSRDLAQQQLV